MKPYKFYNGASDFAISLQIITEPINILTSSGLLGVVPSKIRAHSDDVYFDNSKFWCDFLWWIK